MAARTDLRDWAIELAREVAAHVAGWQSIRCRALVIKAAIAHPGATRSEWAVIAEEFEGENPLQRRFDVASMMTVDRHQPFTGGASRQRPVRREIRVRLPMRLPMRLRSRAGKLSCRRSPNPR